MFAIANEKEFVLANEESAKKIQIVGTERFIFINSNLCRLFVGKTLDDKVRIDRVLETRGLLINDYLINKTRIRNNLGVNPGMVKVSQKVEHTDYFFE